MTRALSFWDPRCLLCGTPHPVTPDPWAFIEWAESHKCKITERKQAA